MEVVEADPNDPDFVAWDERISDVNALRISITSHANSDPFRYGSVVGYRYAQLRTPKLLWFPDAVTLGRLVRSMSKTR